MVGLKPPGIPYKVGKKILKKEGVKVPKRKEVQNKPMPSPLLER